MESSKWDYDQFEALKEKNLFLIIELEKEKQAAAAAAGKEEPKKGKYYLLFIH